MTIGLGALAAAAPTAAEDAAEDATTSFASLAGAQPRLHLVAGFGGISGTYVDGEQSWALIASYEQPLSDHLALELGYYNEGHPDGTGHQDGLSLQLFGSVLPFAALASDDEPSVLADRLRLRAGAGPSVDFDSVGSPDQPHHEETGAGLMLTGALDVRVAGGLWLGPRVVQHWGFGTQDALVAGVDLGFEIFPARAQATPDWSAVAATGKSIRNANGGSGIPAYVAVARRGLFGSDAIGVSGAFLSIDGPNERKGVAVGPRLSRRFGETSDLELGFGAAPYLYDDGKDTGQDTTGVAALIEAAASYRVWRNLKLVASFMREAGSPSQQNYDVVLGGFGVDFDLPSQGGVTGAAGTSRHGTPDEPGT